MSKGPKGASAKDGVVVKLEQPFQNGSHHFDVDLYEYRLHTSSLVDIDHQLHMSFYTAFEIFHRGVTTDITAEADTGRRFVITGGPYAVVGGIRFLYWKDKDRAPAFYFGCCPSDDGRCVSIMYHETLCHTHDDGTTESVWDEELIFEEISKDFPFSHIGEIVSDTPSHKYKQMVNAVLKDSIFLSKQHVNTVDKHVKYHYQISMEKKIAMIFDRKEKKIRSEAKEKFSGQTEEQREHIMQLLEPVAELRTDIEANCAWYDQPVQRRICQLNFEKTSKLGRAEIIRMAHSQIEKYLRYKISLPYSCRRGCSAAVVLVAAKLKSRLTRW